MAADPKLSDAEYSAALDRLRAHQALITEGKLAKAGVDTANDQGTLARAADLHAIFADQARWEKYPLPKRQGRSKRVRPRSVGHFVRWAADAIGYTPRRVEQLLAVHEVLATITNPVPFSREATETTLRPIVDLVQAGRVDEAVSILREAQRKANGAVPTRKQVQSVKTARIRAAQTAIKRTDPGTATSSRAAQAEEIRQHIKHEMQQLYKLLGSREVEDFIRSDIVAVHNQWAEASATEDVTA
jgi:hypothetical protein